MPRWGSAVTLVKSRTGLGTNAILTRPPGALPHLFGADSFREHQAKALELGLSIQLLDNNNLALDIDEPEDLVYLTGRVGADRDTASLRYIRDLKLDERLAQASSRSSSEIGRRSRNWAALPRDSPS